MMHPESDQGGTGDGKVTFILKSLMTKVTIYIFITHWFFLVYIAYNKIFNFIMYQM